MPDQTKERIVAAAYRALVKRGYHATAMKDIAAEAGVAPGLAHYYFETKEDLLVAAIEHACGPLMAAWEAAGVSLTERFGSPSIGKQRKSKPFKSARVVKTLPRKGVLRPTLLTSPRWRTAQPRFCQVCRLPGVAREQRAPVQVPAVISSARVDRTLTSCCRKE